MDTFEARLVDEYFSRLHAYVRMRVPAQDCDDVVAEILLRAIQRREQLRGEAAPWLFAIARSQVAEHYRKKEPAMRLEDTSTSSDPPASVPLAPCGRGVRGEGAGAEATPLEQLEKAEFCARLQRQIAVLPEIERDVIALKFTDGLSNTQIAELLGITPNHLGVLLHRALTKLKHAMSADA
ncbi:MAG TPA: sigma-70 family RNA polymerase sigma factor [Planctomycetota bacterium]